MTHRATVKIELLILIKTLISAESLIPQHPCDTYRRISWPREWNHGYGITRVLSRDFTGLLISVLYTSLDVHFTT